MTKFQKTLARILVLVLVAAMVLPMVACRRNEAEDPTETQSTEPVTYTVRIESAGGMAMSGVGVYIYEDETLSELVWFDQTNDQGEMTFTDVARDTYVAVLSDVPTGYAAEEFYPITGQQTKIVLQAGKMDEENIQDLTYKLGDMMMDFTLVGPDGTEYTLSELLKQKKAVVLNFWYIECGPCNAEFPFLQEAYEKYSDDIALLALNPINKAEDIAAFQKEKGYTFPMLSCGIEWEKLMGITAYPTTVIIDRFGNICLIHKGSIDNAKTFEDAFAYFAADEYEQKVIKDITELETEGEEGTAENPTDATGKASFEVTVEPGKEVYTELYKATGMYLSIKGQSKDFYVLYNDKKYTPDSSNTVGFVVSTGDNYTPSVFGIGNTGTETQKFGVTLSFLPGTFNNPYAMKLGEFTVKVNAGNDQGVNYVYYAPENGTLTVQCLKATSGVEYGYTLYNTSTMAVRSLEEDGTKDDSGKPTLSVKANKGDKILLTVATLPDDTFSYPAGTFTFLASYEAGEGVTVEKIEKIDYTVTVTDENDQPLKDIAVWLTKDSQTASAKTDEKGVATLNLGKGTYGGSVSVPEGYTLENNAFQLTEEAPAATVKLTTAVDKRVDYTVRAEDPDGNPVAGVEVMVIGGESGTTDENGNVVFLLEPGNYSVMTVSMPAGFQCGDMLTLTAETLSGTFVLTYAPGTAQNPIMLTELDNTVTNPGTVYYGGRFSGATMEITGAAGFQVLLGDQTLTDTDGVVTCPVVAEDPRSPVIFAITGDGDYRITFTYPVGHRTNPAQLVLGENKVTLSAGSSDYFYNWTAIGDGELTLTMDPAAHWVYSTANLTTGVAGETHWSDDETPVITETLTVSAGDKIQVAVNTYDPADMFNSPAGDVVFQAAFVFVAEAADFTTALIPAGGSVTYRLLNPEAGTLAITDANAYVVSGGTTYQPDSTGKLSVKLGSGEYDQLVIGNTGDTDAEFSVTFTWPKGSRRNPEEIKRFPVTTRLQAGDTDGYYYVYKPTQTGTLTLTKNVSTPANVDYNLTLSRNDGAQTVTPNPADTTKTVSLYVIPGDAVVLHLQAVPAANGTYPAVTVVTKGTFVVDYSTYTVTFDANGGTLTGDATMETTNAKLASLPADPVRSGYEFTGWYDAATGGNQVTTSTVINKNTTVYAHWNKVEYTVTFNAGAGVLEGEASSVTVDYKLSALPTATLEGYEFLGWYTLPAGGEQVSVDTVYSAHTELFAQWKSNNPDADTGVTVNYEVSVLNETGEPVTGDVYVTWQGAKTVTKVINNASGTVSAALPSGDYTIILSFTGSYKDYRYDSVSAKATAEKTAVTIQIAKPISSTAEETPFDTGSGKMTTKDLELGATYVKLNSSQSNYAIIDGTAYCFFRFLITEEGKYGFTTSNGAPISNWGTNTYFIQNRTTEEERLANAFEIEIKESNFAGDNHVLQLILAVEVSDEYPDTVVQIKDAGDAEYTYLDAPFTVYEGTQTPEVVFENGKAMAIEENIFHLTTGGKTLTYVNMLTDQAVKGDDGYYHLNSKTGPILYVNLGENAPYVSMGVLTGAIGQFGTGFKKIFFNEDGTPVVNGDGTYKKEDYTDTMIAYCVHADPTTGVYPLNDDLIYMLQNGGEYKGWYTPGSGAYLFEETDITVDNSLAWMFAVCYLK